MNAYKYGVSKLVRPVNEHIIVKFLLPVVYAQVEIDKVLCLMLYLIYCAKIVIFDFDFHTSSKMKCKSRSAAMSITHQ